MRKKDAPAARQPRARGGLRRAAAAVGGRAGRSGSFWSGFYDGAGGPGPGGTVPAADGIPGGGAARSGLLPGRSRPAREEAAPRLAAAEGVDESGAFKAFLSRAMDGASRPLPEAARGVRFLLVPGYAWKLVGPMYFRPALEFLRSQGLDAEMVPTDPLAPAAENARVIQEAVESSPKPVVLLGHSKGGLDSLEALRTRPDLQEKVRKLLAIQSPYFGSPLADWFLRRPWLAELIGLAAKLFMPRRLRGVRVLGRRETIRELSQGRRGDLERRRPPLREGLELFSVASHVDAAELTAPLERIKIGIGAMPAEGTDGVVTAADSLVPGSRYAVVPAVRHWEPVLSPPPRSWFAFLRRSLRPPTFTADFTEAAVHWLFSREAGAAALPPPADPAVAAAETRLFLRRLGYEGDAERSLETIRAHARQRTSHMARGTAPLPRRAGGLSPERRRVLRDALPRWRSRRAARELAALAMGGLAAGGYSREGYGRLADLTARLVSLGPLPPPEALPPGLARAPRREVARWLAAESARRMAAQAEDLDRAFREAGVTAELTPLLGELLLPLYGDPNETPGLHAGRALAASLARHARRHGPAGLEDLLQERLRERGVELRSLVGARFEIRDRDGRVRRFDVQEGDFLGIRRRGRTSAEIVAGARPHWTRWWAAFRQRLLGPIPAIWLDPAEEEAVLAPGQPVRNLLRRAWRAAREWLARRRYFLKGYGHVGLVSVREAHGVSLAWVLHDTASSREGEARRDALLGEFLQPGLHVRLGLARFSPERVRDEFLRQARANGLPEDRALLRLARGNAGAFLGELNRRAVGEAERMMALGFGYDYGWSGRPWRAHCASFLIFAHLLGSLFHPKSFQDMWHPIALFLKRVGWPNARDLRTDKEIIWPGSFFVDPKVERHDYVDLDPAGPRPGTPFEAGAPAEAAPQAWVEALRRSLIVHLPFRRAKRQGAVGWRTGLNDSSPYFEALERLWEEAARVREGAGA